MESNFFPNRALRWSFWANILFLVGMQGYLLMDGYDYVYPNTLNPFIYSVIYIFLAGLFVIDNNLEIISIYHTDHTVHRYYTMVSSSLLDAIGSFSYFLGALFTITILANSPIVFICNVIGVFGFAAGAAVHMFVLGSTVLYYWANILNLSASLSYVVAIIISNVSLARIIVILADCVYFIDAILYFICWFYDRRFAMEQEKLLLVTK